MHSPYLSKKVCPIYALLEERENDPDCAESYLDCILATNGDNRNDWERVEDSDWPP
jgi:hypothetical protein